MFPQQASGLCLKKQLSDRPNSFTPGGVNEQNVPFNDVANMIFLTLILTLDAFYATEIFGDAIHLCMPFFHQANKSFHLDQLNNDAW